MTSIPLEIIRSTIWFSDELKESWSQSICLNPLNIRNKIWRQSIKRFDYNWMFYFCIPWKHRKTSKLDSSLCSEVFKVCSPRNCNLHFRRDKVLLTYLHPYTLNPFQCCVVIHIDICRFDLQCKSIVFYMKSNFGLKWVNLSTPNTA